MGEEYLQFRFGIVAVKKGFVTQDQVVEALNIQVNENVSSEKHRLLGEILVEMGAMDSSEVNQVLESMSIGQ